LHFFALFHSIIS